MSADGEALRLRNVEGRRLYWLEPDATHYFLRGQNPLWPT